MVPPRKRAATKAVKEIVAKEPTTNSWYSLAKASGDFLSKFEGVNYYQLLDEGVLDQTIINNDNVTNVHFEAKLIEVNNIKGNKTKDSPEEPIEGILSVPLSVAKKIRSQMEEKQFNLQDLAKSIVGIQKTGSGIDTRYPSVTLWSENEFFGDPEEEK